MHGKRECLSHVQDRAAQARREQETELKRQAEREQEIRNIASARRVAALAEIDGLLAALRAAENPGSIKIKFDGSRGQRKHQGAPRAWRGWVVTQTTMRHAGSQPSGMSEGAGSSTHDCEVAISANGSWVLIPDWWTNRASRRGEQMKTLEEIKTESFFRAAIDVVAASEALRKIASDAGLAMKPSNPIEP